MKESKIITFEQQDLEKILTAVCKKKFPGLAVEAVDFGEENGINVVFAEFNPDEVVTSNEN